MDTKMPRAMTLSDFLKMTHPDPGLKITKSRQCLTLRWGRWKTEPYDIPLAQLKTERGILSWTLHLSEKKWVTSEQLAQFIWAALDAAKIDLYGTTSAS